jgi:hypothetical protein
MADNPTADNKTAGKTDHAGQAPASAQNDQSVPASMGERLKMLQRDLRELEERMTRLEHKTRLQLERYNSCSY